MHRLFHQHGEGGEVRCDCVVTWGKRPAYPYDFMEPNAAIVGDDWRRRPGDKSTECERSIAISLKRIADYLERKEKRECPSLSDR